MTEHPGLSGRRILVVEDECLVSMLAEDILLEAGCEVLLAMRLQQAMQIARSEDFDCAILDVNLGDGDTSYAVAQVLARRAIPFAFASGYGPQALSPEFRDQVAVQKPYTPETLLAATSRMLAEGTS